MENNSDTNSAVNGFIYGFSIKALTTKNYIKNETIFVDINDPRFLRVTPLKLESKSRLLIRSTQISCSVTKINNIQCKIAIFEDEIRKNIVKIMELIGRFCPYSIFGPLIEPILKQELKEGAMYLKDGLHALEG